MHYVAEVAVFSCLLGSLWSQGDAPSKSFIFVSPQLIVTAEVAGPHSFVANFINLSDFVMVVQPNEFIYKGAAGRFYIGQVFEKESKDNRGQVSRYAASTLLRGKAFSGLTILGDFLEQEAIQELSVRIGAKRYYLMPVARQEFELLAARIGELDLESEDPRAALEEANLQSLGTVRSTDGTSEWDQDWQGLIRQDGVIVPKIIEKPPVAPTDEAVRTKTYGRVKLSAVITRNGGPEGLRVEKGLGRGLDERALDAVKNSWMFLPAVKNGEVLEGRLEFFVDFPPPTPANKPQSAHRPFSTEPLRCKASFIDKADCLSSASLRQVGAGRIGFRPPRLSQDRQVDIFGIGKLLILLI